MPPAAATMAAGLRWPTDVVTTPKPGGTMASEEPRGGEFYETDAVRSAYLEHRHSGGHSPNTVMEEPAFLAALGSVAGQRVLDLGCGDGSTSPLLMAGGAASYLGVDGSPGMIVVANEMHGGGHVRFLEGDIEDASPGEGEFDVVISRMALHYIERLDVVLGQIRQALPVGGRLIFSVVHPVITSHDSSDGRPRTSWTVDGYFDRGARERPWFGSTVTWQHRTVEDYVSLLLNYGFRLDVLSECEPDADLLADEPDELARRRRVPLMLLLGATRSG